MTKHNIDEIMVETRKTAIYHDGVNDFVNNTDSFAMWQILSVNYAVLGLVNEAGEVAGKLKKFFRGDSDWKKTKEALASENRDTLYYCLRVFDDLDLMPSDEAYKLMQKLLERKERGVLKGDGDAR